MKKEEAIVWIIVWDKEIYNTIYDTEIAAKRAKRLFPKDVRNYWKVKAATINII